jgi:hypothetical protein
VASEIPIREIGRLVDAVFHRRLRIAERLLRVALQLLRRTFRPELVGTDRRAHALFGFADRLIREAGRLVYCATHDSLFLPVRTAHSENVVARPGFASVMHEHRDQKDDRQRDAKKPQQRAFT